MLNPDGPPSTEGQAYDAIMSEIPDGKPDPLEKARYETAREHSEQEHRAAT